MQGKFLIIFAITSEYKTIYDALSKQIDNSEVAILEKDAEEDRIVNIISTDFILNGKKWLHKTSLDL